MGWNTGISDDDSVTGVNTRAVSRSAERIRTRMPSATKWGWVIASSPLWLVMVLISLAVFGGGLSSSEIGMVFLISAGILYLAAVFDLEELTRRGFSISFSRHLIWCSPLVFLVIRGRKTRDDFASYRLAWAHFFFILLSVFISNESSLVVSFVLGTALPR